jgi:5-hydroxyisourate hydrolase
MGATLTTHVLDTARGRPAEGVLVGLFAIEDGHRRHVATRTTDADGRASTPFATDLAPGTYELLFSVTEYFSVEGIASFYDAIPVRFRIEDNTGHYHVPLLLTPWGYSTYRGS